MTIIAIEQELIWGKRKIMMYRYRNPLDCVGAYFGKKADELTNEKMIGYNAKKEQYEYEVEEILTNILALGVWGFTNHKNAIHYWLSPSAEKKFVAGFIAHELAHMTKPFHRSRSKEEYKAGMYQQITEIAFDIAFRLDEANFEDGDEDEDEI